MTPSHALWLTRALGAAILLLQTAEILSVRHALDERGVWRPSFAREDFGTLPAWLRALITPFVGERGFIAVLVVRLLLAALLFVDEPRLFGGAAGLAVLSQLVVSARFGGTFNGGSDGMSLVVLLGLFVASLPFEAAARVGLAYIAAQSLLSYFIAGVVKIREADWRSGRALSAFLRARRYGIPPHFSRWLGQPRLALSASWAVMLFECAFPLGLLRPELMGALIAIAFLFHLGNWIVFGLNRFVLAWAATYPALLYVASEMARIPHGP